MNKRLFYYLFAVLCTVTLFTSCSDDDGDDTPTVIPIEQEIACLLYTSPSPRD